MRRLRWQDYIWINLFWLGVGFRNAAVGSVLVPYLVAGFVSGTVMNTALGAVRTAGLVIAMLAQPAMGLLSDYNTSRLGRRRPFIAIGVLLDLIFLAAIGLAGNYGLLLVAALLQQFSANTSHGALQGLIPDLVPEDQRGRAAAIKAIFELLPIILIALTVARLVGASKIGWAIVVTGGGLFLTMLLTMVFVREEPLREKPAAPLAPPMLRVPGMLAGIGVGAAAGLAGGGLVGGAAGLITWPLAGAAAARAVGAGVGGLVAMALAVGAGVWAGAAATLGREDAAAHRAFTWWIVNRLLFLAAAISVQGFAPYFIMYAFKIPRAAAAVLTGNLMAVVGVCTLVAAVPSGWLGDRVGPKRLAGLGGLVASASTLLLLAAIWAPSLGLLYGVGSMLGLATGIFMATNWALGTRLAPAGEAGRYLGVSNLAGAGAGMIGAGIGGPLADLLNGYRPGLGYFAIFACYGVLFALSAASLRWVKIEK